MYNLFIYCLFIGQNADTGGRNAINEIIKERPCPFALKHLNMTLYFL